LEGSPPVGGFDTGPANPFSSSNSVKASVVASAAAPTPNSAND